MANPFSYGIRKKFFSGYSRYDRPTEEGGLAMGGLFRALRCDRKRAVRLPLRLEILEDRTLLSGIATPDYVIFHGSSGGGGVATPYGNPRPTGLMPSPIRHAYGFGQISYDGTRIAIAMLHAY